MALLKRCPCTQPCSCTHIWLLSLFVAFCMLVQAVGGKVDPKQLTFNGVREKSPQHVNANVAARPEITRASGRTNGNGWRISDDVACSADVHRLCPSTSWQNNFVVLECLQDEREANDDISSDCHHLLWNYKHNLTMDERFEVAAAEVCKTALRELKECQNHERGKGYIISCLVDNRVNISDYECHQFITRMASIIFSDYRLICGFVDNCKDDINRLHCGRISNDPKVVHSQGEVVACLEHALTDQEEHRDGEQLQDGCKKAILRVAELSSDDFHLDRHLYFACRDDRERFCEKVTAGDGRVYKCLFNHKFEDDMSEKCRNVLTIRQKLIAQDYKTSYLLAKACRLDLKYNHCTAEVVPHLREVRLSQLLICLENAMHNGKSISSDCQGEMLDFRHILMEDYSLSPEIVLNCHSEISSMCFGLNKKGRTLHCLMRVERGDGGKGNLGNDCRRALLTLVQEADLGSDYRVDRALNEACESVIQTACHGIRSGDPMVLSCLMEHLYTDHMVDECEHALLELQYFISRDWKLDPMLYKRCNSDASRLCHSQMMNESTPGAIISCLYRHAYRTEAQGSRLSRNCKHEVWRILHQRALDMRLNPELQEQCLKDLGKWCSDKPEFGTELECLQEHMDELWDPCKQLVSNFTMLEGQDIEIEVLLMRACDAVVQTYCHDVSDTQSGTGELMQCLIKNKHQHEMNEKCAVGVMHFQLIQMKDFRFSFKFKTACKEDVLKLCPNIRKKADVVICLSTMVRNDTLQEVKEPRVSLKCQRQLRVDELEMSEDIRFDPDMLSYCDADIRRFCKDVSFGGAQVLECLKDKKKSLSLKCHEKIFRREEIEMADPEMDFNLIRVCKQMIKRFCATSDTKSLMQCLKQNKNSEMMDPKCKQMITKRQITQYSDYRLNPALKRACRADIPKFCKSLLDHEKNDQELEGKVISCLKMKYGKQRLSSECEDQMGIAIKDAAIDYRLDPQLQQFCSKEILHLCQEEAAAQEQTGQVEECLKMNLPKITSKDCKMEIINILRESKADVFVDPVLHTACALDLKHYCAGIPPGEGRQMSCLLDLLEDKTVRLQPPCKNMLTERKEMWEYAYKVAPVEDLQGLAQQLLISPSRNYFLAVILVGLCVLFAIGLLCGRITKRVSREIKDR